MKKINHLTKQYQQELTKKEIDYLQNFYSENIELLWTPKDTWVPGN